MEQIYEIREILISVYKKYEYFVGIILKFLLGLVIYSLIGSIGYSAGIFESITTMPLKLPFTVFMGVLFAIMPLNVNYALIILNITMQFSSKLEVAAIICMVLLLVFFFYGRIGGKESALIIAVFFGYYFKIPYAVPLFAGLYCGITSIIPLSIGVMLYNLMPVAMYMGENAESAGMSIMDMPATFANLYLSFTAALQETNEWAVGAFVFAMVVVVVYIISKLEINYAKEIAIVMGGFVNIVCFIAAVFATDFEISILGLLASTLVSMAFVYIIKFFDLALDYQRVEKVEFEDDDNYYYVKVIPKITMNNRQAQSQPVKRIRGQGRIEGPEDIFEEDYRYERDSD